MRKKALNSYVVDNLFVQLILDNLITDEEGAACHRDVVLTMNAEITMDRAFENRRNGKTTIFNKCMKMQVKSRMVKIVNDTYNTYK